MPIDRYVIKSVSWKSCGKLPARAERVVRVKSYDGRWHPLGIDPLRLRRRSGHFLRCGSLGQCGVDPKYGNLEDAKTDHRAEFDVIVAKAAGNCFSCLGRLKAAISCSG